jgi:hypothetical protein
MENNDWVKKEQEVQPRKFVYLDDDPKAPAGELRAKDFVAGGKLFDKKIAVQGHTEQNSIYEVAVIKGVAKKVRILYQGDVKDGAFSDCDYAMGIFEIACAELCGMGHYTMRGFLYVEPAVVYEKWLKGEMEDVSEPPVAWKFWRD